MPSGRQFVTYLWVPALAAGVFWLAYDEGSYGLTSRNSIAVVVLWAIVLASAAGFWPAARVPGSALVSGSLLGAFAALDRPLRALGGKPREGLQRVRPGLPLSRHLRARGRRLAARKRAPLARRARDRAHRRRRDRAREPALPALVRALTTELAQSFPTASKRLSFPVDYWNGLATLVAFAIPCLLYFAAESRAVVRGLAVAPLPALAATLYLTSSRGGWVAAGIAIVVLMALTSRRWATAGALLIGGAASAGAVAVLLARDELVDSPLTSSVAESQGRSAALLIALLCAAAGVAYGLLAIVVPSPPRASRAASTAFAAVLVLVAVALVVAAHPVRRYDNFKEIPPELTGASVQEHLFSTSGNGRWQWWTSAVDEWQTTSDRAAAAPVPTRRGGPSTPSIPAFVRDAHSLYLETLGELGLVGLALLLAFLVSCLVAGARRLRGRTEGERAAVAALLALVAAFLFEAGIDWMWELTAVSVIAVLALGLLDRPGHGAGVLRAGGGRDRAEAPPASPRRSRGDRVRPHRRRGDSSAREHGGAPEPGGGRPPATSSRRSTGRSRPRASSPGRRRPTSSSRSSRSSAGGSTKPAPRSSTRSSTTSPTGGSGSSRRASRRRPATSRRRGKASPRRGS